jgi:flagellar hook-basal body complex protein FliE
MANPAAAANAYAAMSSLIAGAGDAAPAARGSGFGDMLEKSLAGFAEQGRASDETAVRALSGKADVVDVVTAVAESELALDTLVSVRDKVIAAYEEIMRMPI